MLRDRCRQQGRGVKQGGAGCGIDGGGLGWKAGGVGSAPEARRREKQGEDSNCGVEEVEQRRIPSAASRLGGAGFVRVFLSFRFLVAEQRRVHGVAEMGSTP
jgi:hypothetical protein